MASVALWTSTPPPLAPSSDASPFLPPGARASGFCELDAILCEPESHGVVMVQGIASVLDALGRHIERRTRGSGRRVVVIDGRRFDNAVRELALRLGASGSDAATVAQGIVEKADRAVLVVREGSPSGWGREILAQLSTVEGCRCLAIVLSGEGEDAHAHRIEVDASFSVEELRLWWEAIARDPERPFPSSLDRLDALDAWWSAARLTPPEKRPDPVELSETAKKLVVRLWLSQRSLSRSLALRLGTEDACVELLEKGVVVVEPDGRLVAGRTTPPWGEGEPPIELRSAEDARIVAEVIRELKDPWASARAAELFVMAGDVGRAESAAACALEALSDPVAREDLWLRWLQALKDLPFEDAAPILLRAAELARSLGDVDLAFDLARDVAARCDSYEALLILGRVTVARGDLPTAGIYFGKAIARAPSPLARARAASELAEVHYMVGELDRARHLAEEVLEGSCDAETRLHARNVLGKLLLARAAWQEAEAHFAADACEAELSGDVTGELRARLNRAIALLSRGRRDEARAMLRAILEEGEMRGDLRAVGFALTNLSIVAILTRNYAEALRLSERAFEVRRKFGDKISIALLTGNLAEMRLDLGQVDEAEQALAFGRNTCGPGMPITRAVQFAFVSARIHLARGRTVDAAADVAVAISNARSSSNGARLGDCYRLAAWIALEDGDLERVARSIALARESSRSAAERAQVELLEASRARAAGEPFAEPARTALSLAREADDPESAREACVLLFHAAMLEGDARSARGQLSAAIAYRSRIAQSLPAEMREKFLARRDLQELARLEGMNEPGSSDAGHDVPWSGFERKSVRPDVRIGGAPEAPALTRMIGRAPAMLALRAAIQKVGQSDATVLIHGESGTGKELVAEAIHEASERRAGPLVKVNCAALVETLLLSELFGHEKGSFTGAASRRRGRFELAEGGTLFLDEIGDISPRTQVALLRVLQDRTFERVGGVSSIRANVRIICATHRDLAAMVERGEFREDLYYRLRGLVLDVPALRDRIDDLPAIAEEILVALARERGALPKRLSPGALRALMRHRWPGNVRELENALRAASIFAEGDLLELEDFTRNVDGIRSVSVSYPAPPPPESGIGLRALHGSAPVMAAPSSESPLRSPSDAAYAFVRSGTSLSDMKRDIERECIARALTETNGNITRAAALLGMKRPRLSQLVKQYGLGADSETEDKS